MLACLAEVATTTPPPDLPSAADSQFDFQGWIEIEDDPEPFLALGLCSSAWLDAALPILRFATEIAPLDGDALMHFDVRSDNLCIRDGRAVLIDWNFACVGNPVADVACLAPEPPRRRRVPRPTRSSRTASPSSPRSSPATSVPTPRGPRSPRRRTSGRSSSGRLGRRSPGPREPWVCRPRGERQHLQAVAPATLC